MGAGCSPEAAVGEWPVRHREIRTDGIDDTLALGMGEC